MELVFWTCMALLIYTYIGYLGALLVLTKSPFFPKHPVIGYADNWPAVDILIVAYNEERVIGRRIENCLSVDYPKDSLNIWVVSDGSTDNTNEIIRRYERENKNVHTLIVPRAGKANAINAAIPHLVADFIVFSDANVEFSAQSVQNMMKHFADKNVGCVCGKLIYRNPKEIISGKGESLYWKYETLLKCLESKIGYVAGANGAIYAIRKYLVEKLPKGTINDDFILSMSTVKKGFKCLYEENSIAYEEVALSPKAEFFRHVRDGAGHYLAIVHLLGLLNPFLGIRSFIFWSHRIIRWIAPFLIMAVLVMNMFLLGKFLYNLIFIFQLIFYMLAAIGLFEQGNRKPPMYMYIPLYFLSLNIALLLGFFKAITGAQKMTWERTDRACI